VHDFLYTIIIGYVDQNEWSGSSLEMLYDDILGLLLILESNETY